MLHKITRKHTHTVVLLSCNGFASSSRIGMIGLGQMGRKMTQKFLEDGHRLNIYDIDMETTNQIIDMNKSYSSSQLSGCDTIEKVVKDSDYVFSILPNDMIVTTVANEVLAARKKDSNHKPFVHISCSTISPVTSRRIESEYETSTTQSTFIASPVFARPDGLAKRQATWMIAGKNKEEKVAATKLLESMGNVVDFGDDIGAANVVKLCGNFLIASSIESIGEAMALAEKHNVDRTQVMDLLSSTIFNCLIYKGYGQRVADRDHRPGGFSLELGLKDVTLVNQAARQADVPMPFLSILVDRYTSSKAKGRSAFDWSAIGLSIAEDAGIDISKDLARNKKDIEDGRTY